MRNKNQLHWVPWLVFVVLFISADRWNACSRQKVYEKSSIGTSLPAPDPNMGKPMFFSIQEQRWIYFNNPGAKAPTDNYEPYRDIEKQMKRNIPIYRKKTYWGEEWDEETGQEEDIIWDDHGDDNELDKN